MPELKRLTAEQLAATLRMVGQMAPVSARKLSVYIAALEAELAVAKEQALVAHLAEHAAEDVALAESGLQEYNEHLKELDRDASLSSTP